MTLSKSGRFRAEASFQQPPPSSISSINLSYCSLSVASFTAAKHIALTRAHHPRQPNPHSVCGSSLAQSTRGFVLWRLPDAGPGARRSISHGRHPKPCTIAAVSNRRKKTTRSPRRRRQAAQVARSGRAHARRLVVKLAAETPEMGKFPVNFPVSREFGAETGSHPTASSGTAHM